MIKRAAQAWAFAAILLLPNYVDLTSSAGDARMRSSAPLTGIALAQLTDMAIVALVFFLLMALLRRLPWWPTIRWVLLALLPVLLFVRNLDVFPTEVPHYAVWTASLLWSAIVGVLLLRFPKAARQLRTAGSRCTCAFAIVSSPGKFASKDYARRERLSSRSRGNARGP